MNNVFNFTQYQGIRDREYVELVPTKKLWELREFDRRTEPKFSDDDSNETINDLKRRIEEHGFTTPVRIEFAYRQGCAIIAEGNHRLVAAMELGLTHIPALVYRSESKNPKSHKIMYNVTKPYVVPELMRPTDIGLLNCLNLSDGKPALPTLLDFYGDDSATIAFKDIEANLIDVDRTFGGFILSYQRSDMTDMNKLRALFSSGTNLLEGEEGMWYDSKYSFRAVKDTVWREQYDLENEEHGSVLGMNFRNHLIAKIRTSKSDWQEYVDWLDEEYGYGSLEDLGDRELIHTLNETEFTQFQDVVKTVFVNIWKKWDIRRSVYRLYSEQNGVYGDYMELEEDGDNITLMVSRKELSSYKHLKKNDTSLKDILIREFKAESYGFNIEDDSSTHMWEDPKFSLAIVQNTFDELYKKIINK